MQPQPQFWATLTDRSNANVSHAFALHGNVHDYVHVADAAVPLAVFLHTMLQRHYDIVIAVDPARGITFPVPDHRDLFIRLLDLAPKAAAVSPVAAALGVVPQTAVALPGELDKITALLDRILTQPHYVDDAPISVAVILAYSEYLVPEADLSRTDTATLTRLLQWGRSPFVGQRHLLITLSETHTALHSELRRASARWEPIAIAMPDESSRLAFIRQRVADLAVPLRDVTAETVAAATGALSLVQCEDILFRGLDADGVTAQMVRERKDTVVAAEFADVLAITQPRFGFERIGGYDYLKTYLSRYVVQAWAEDRMHIAGILLPGPAGTGKTQLAEAIAGAAGVTFVTFQLAKILGQYVGNSERNLARALDAIMSLGRCVLFLDEIDQLTGRGEGAGSSVDNRVFAALLSFLEDPDRRGRVLVIGSTNRPDLLDAALRSRFDRTAPILPPTHADRAAIIATLTAVLLGVPVDAATTAAVAAATEGWTGRDLRALVLVAGDFMADGDPLADAFAQASTTYRARLREIGSMTRLALAEVTDLRLVPPHERDRVASDAETPPATPATPTHDTKRRRIG